MAANRNGGMLQLIVSHHDDDDDDDDATVGTCSRVLIPIRWRLMSGLVTVPVTVNHYNELVSADRYCNLFQ